MKSFLRKMNWTFPVLAVLSACRFSFYKIKITLEMEWLPAPISCEFDRPSANRVLARVNDFHAEYMLSYVTGLLIGDFVVVNLVVFLAEHWERWWLIFPLVSTSQTIYITPHFLLTTTEKRDLFESDSWPGGGGVIFFRGRTLHLWQLQLSRVTTTV